MTRELLVVVGARPNFVKVAPVLRAVDQIDGLRARLLHTGQHYDHALSASFVEQLGLPDPEFHLGVGSGSHAEQTAAVMLGVEAVLSQEAFDAVLVAGDVNSTMAAALAAPKLGIGVIHLEAGLRSGDWSMPEEVNRVVTDRVADLLLCHSEDAVENLITEGADPSRIALVGNTMIDPLLALRDAADATGALERLGLVSGGYLLVTLHRPGVVDNHERLSAVLAVLEEIACDVPVVLPLHPRTAARITDQGGSGRSIVLLESLEYLDFICLEMHARLVVTDSGGVQEETSALGIPCITYRTTTERPVTVRLGTNRVIGLEPDSLRVACRRALADEPPVSPPRIPLWDGHAGQRAAEAIAAYMRVRHRGIWQAEYTGRSRTS